MRGRAGLAWMACLAWMARLWWMALLGSLPGLLGCEGAGGPPSRAHTSSSANTGAALIDTEAFVAWANQGHALPSPCAGFEPPAVGDRVVRLHVFLGDGVADLEARASLTSMLAYYGQYGVRFQVQPPVRRFGRASLIGDGDARGALQPLSAFLVEHGSARTPDAPLTVHAVVLRRIASPSSPASRYFERLDGLSVGEHLRKRGDPLVAALGVPGPITPTLVLGLDDMKKRRPGTLDLTAAHELGHLLGLQHAPGANLMNPAPQTCAPPLTDGQLGVMLASTAATAATAAKVE